MTFRNIDADTGEVTDVKVNETVENLRECANALKRDCLKHKHYDNNRDTYKCDPGCFRYSTCLFVNNQMPVL